MRTMITAVMATAGAATWWAGDLAVGHDEQHGPSLVAPEMAEPAFALPEHCQPVSPPATAEPVPGGPDARWPGPPPFAGDRQSAPVSGYEYRHSESHSESRVEEYHRHDDSSFVPRYPAPAVPQYPAPPQEPSGFRGPAPDCGHRPAYGHVVHVEQRHCRPYVECVYPAYVGHHAHSGYHAHSGHAYSGYHACGGQPAFVLGQPGYDHGCREVCAPRPRCRRGLFGLDLRLGF